MGVVSVHFFPLGSRINSNVIKPGTYKRGTAKLTPDSKKLVNKLTVKGGKALSEEYSQAITVGTVPIHLDYSPRAPITVTIGGSEKTLGIQNIHEPGTYDFLLNAAEKLLIPDQCTTGTGTISYLYEYPIKIILEEPNSQEQYGVFEDIYRVDSDDRDTVLGLGLQYLYKYCQPVISGSIEPFTGVYRPGEYILTQIPDLNIDTYLTIKEVSYSSIPGKSQVDIKLQLETPERDVSDVLKDLAKRLSVLERASLNDDDSPVEIYIAREQVWQWLETIVLSAPVEAQERQWWREESSLVAPVPVDETTEWEEESESTIHACPLPSDSLYPSEEVIPC